MAGLHFHKLDLHTHTPASKCYLEQQQKPSEIVEYAISRGLAGMAITDHNTAEWIDAMKKAADGTDLVIFPGVELSLEYGHIVALFDPTATQKEVEGLLGSLDISPAEFGKSETICAKTVYEVVEKIHERHGLAVLAHIDQEKGIFHAQSKVAENGKVSVPVALSKMLNEAGYDAVECANPKLPDGFDEVHHVKHQPAFYQASDNPHPQVPIKHSVEGLATRYSWFKMEAVNLEGLRQCFADPEVRIRLMGNEKDVPYPRILSLSVGNAGFLHDQTFYFHEGLNSIIGGKGVGKSLAIEFLRFALNQTSVDPDILNDHVKKLQKRLTIGNTVDVVYQRVDGAEFRIRRVFEGPGEHDHTDGIQGQTSCMNTGTGDSYTGDIALAFPILAYSQTEVISIAENKSAQLALIDRFIADDLRALEQDMAQTAAKLHENDLKLGRSIQARLSLGECQQEINTLALRIDAIDRALNNRLLTRMKQNEAKKATAESFAQSVGELEEQIGAWAQQLEEKACPVIADELAEDTLLKATSKKADQAYSHVRERLTDLLAELKEMRSTITDAIEAWMPQFNKVRDEYDVLLKEIGGDQEAKERERKKLETQKADAEKEAERYRSLAEAAEMILTTRQQLLDRLEEAHHQIYAVRRSKFDQLTALSDSKLQLTLEHASDRTAFESRLTEHLKGTGPNAVGVPDRKRIAQRTSPRRLVELVLAEDYHTLAEEGAVSGGLAKRVMERLRSAEDFVDILALQHNCYPADEPSIHYRKEGGEYAELSELSIGQKCTALLIIALCDGTMPVVIDQPEDALDIISVWEDIAKKLRRGKSIRQFILTTHNSSVAVAADSDQFIILKAGATSGRIVAAGAIDGPDVRQAVIEHMEGGEEPIRLRLKKYNLD